MANSRYVMPEFYLSPATILSKIEVFCEAVQKTAEVRDSRGNFYYFYSHP